MADDHTVVHNPVKIQRYLGGVSYPASKQQLLDRARSRGAPDGIRHAVEQLADDRFDSPAAVSKAIGRLNR
jgi:hypothetical protein